MTQSTNPLFCPNCGNTTSDLFGCACTPTPLSHKVNKDRLRKGRNQIYSQGGLPESDNSYMEERSEFLCAIMDQIKSMLEESDLGPVDSAVETTPALGIVRGHLVFKGYELTIDERDWRDAIDIDDKI